MLMTLDVDPTYIFEVTTFSKGGGTSIGFFILVQDVFFVSKARKKNKQLLLPILCDIFFWRVVVSSRNPFKEDVSSNDLRIET